MVAPALNGRWRRESACVPLCVCHCACVIGAIAAIGAFGAVGALDATPRSRLHAIRTTRAAGVPCPALGGYRVGAAVALDPSWTTPAGRRALDRNGSLPAPAPAPAAAQRAAGLPSLEAAVAACAGTMRPLNSGSVTVRHPSPPHLEHVRVDGDQARARTLGVRRRRRLACSCSVAAVQATLHRGVAMLRQSRSRAAAATGAGALSAFSTACIANARSGPSPGSAPRTPGAGRSVLIACSAVRSAVAPRAHGRAIRSCAKGSRS